MGSVVGCLFRRVLEQVLRGRGLGGENIINDGQGIRYLEIDYNTVSEK